MEQWDIHSGRDGPGYKCVRRGHFAVIERLQVVTLRQSGRVLAACYIQSLNLKPKSTRFNVEWLHWQPGLEYAVQVSNITNQWWILLMELMNVDLSRFDVMNVTGPTSKNQNRSSRCTDFDSFYQAFNVFFWNLVSCVCTRWASDTDSESILFKWIRVSH